jgi:hypothetical protein
MPEGVYLNDVFLDGPKSQTLEDLLAMFPQLEPAAREVSQIGVDLIIQVGAPICLAHIDLRLDLFSARLGLGQLERILHDMRVAETLAWIPTIP